MSGHAAVRGGCPEPGAATRRGLREVVAVAPGCVRDWRPRSLQLTGLLHVPPCPPLPEFQGAQALPFSAAAASCSARVRALGDLPPQGAGAVRPLPSHIPYFGNLHGALETSNHLYLPSFLGLTAFFRIPGCCSASRASAKGINTSQEWPSAQD